MTTPSDRQAAPRPAARRPARAAALARRVPLPLGRRRPGLAPRAAAASPCWPPARSSPAPPCSPRSAGSDRRAPRHAMPIARVERGARRAGVITSTIPARDDQAILLHLPGGQFVAYSQQLHPPLLRRLLRAREQERLYCPCHEGVFDPQTGEPIAGPPQRPLPRITLRREGDTLVATEEAPQ